MTHYTEDFTKPKCGADFPPRLSQRIDWIDCPECIKIMKSPVVHFTKAPADSVFEWQAAAMCLCDHWDPRRDTYSRTAGQVTCPECLKLMKPELISPHGKAIAEEYEKIKSRPKAITNHCHHSIDDIKKGVCSIKDAGFGLGRCPECEGWFRWFNRDGIYGWVPQGTNIPRVLGSEAVWNPAYDTASHEMDMTGGVHPDVFIKLPVIVQQQCRLPSGTFTAPGGAPGMATGSPS